MLLNFIRLSWAHFTNLSRSLWTATLSFLSCTNSLRWTRPYYVINKAVKQYQGWHGLLRNMTRYSSPFGPLSHWVQLIPSILIPYPSTTPSIKPLLFQFINKDVGLNHVKSITEIKIDDISCVHQNVILPCLVHSCSSRHLLLYSCLSQCVWVGHSSIIYGICCRPKKRLLGGC